MKEKEPRKDVETNNGLILAEFHTRETGIYP